MGARKGVSDEHLLAAAERNGWSPRAVARDLGLSYGTSLLARLDKLRDAAADESPEPEIEALPSPDVSVEDLIERRIADFARRRAHEEAIKKIGIDIPSSLPMGILHFGDPHVDDDGCDLGLLREHARLVRETPGLYAANVGDTTNNWIGRLARLYADQATRDSDAWRLAEWFVREPGKGKWLYLVAGNHDLWSGAGDPLRWICDGAGALYRPSEVRAELRFPNGSRVRVNCRHDFAGHSQYNPVHGATKALHFGVRDHVAICGHKHVSGYNVLKDPESGIVCHAIQVASYKVFDRYARDKGFRDQHLSPCVLTTIDPTLPPTHPDLIKVWWSAEEGADYLTWLRGRKAAA